MKKIHYIFSAGIIALAMNVEAQDLNKEITIDKDIVPELKESNKIAVTPAIPSLKVKHSNLTFNDRAKTTEVKRAISQLEPADNVDTMEISKYRGYAMLGYFPIYNLDFSAGYQFYNNENTKLNAWVQYNGKSYDATPSSGKEMSIYDHSATIDLSLVQRVNELSILNIEADYGYSYFNYPWWGEECTQNANEFNISAKWKSSIDGLKYDATVGYNYFGFSDGVPFDKSKYVNVGSAFDAVKEHNINLKGHAMLEIEDYTSVALDLGLSIAHDNHLLIPAWGKSKGVLWHGYKNNHDYTHSILTLTPHYDIVKDNFSLKLGANLEYQFDINGEMNISPDVYLDWVATDFFSAYAHFTGGVHQNTMSSIFDVSHYFMPAMAYGNSKLPYVIDAGINVGPFENASLKVYGGYARANDWYMPIFVEDNNHMMNEVDFSGWHLGVAASYNYKEWGKIKASYETAPQSYNEGYYMWRDRAKHVVNASLIVTPINPLDITLDYEYRGGRCSYMQSVVSTIEEVKPEYTRYSLGQVNTLSLGGLYRYNKQLSFFARVENLFNYKYDLLYDIPSQGITGLLGLTYKF